MKDKELDNWIQKKLKRSREMKAEWNSRAKKGSRLENAIKYEELPGYLEKYIEEKGIKDRKAIKDKDFFKWLNKFIPKGMEYKPKGEHQYFTEEKAEPLEYPEIKSPVESVIERIGKRKGEEMRKRARYYSKGREKMDQLVQGLIAKKEYAEAHGGARPPKILKQIPLGETKDRLSRLTRDSGFSLQGKGYSQLTRVHKSLEDKASKLPTVAKRLMKTPFKDWSATDMDFIKDYPKVAFAIKKYQEDKKP